MSVKLGDKYEGNKLIKISDSSSTQFSNGQPSVKEKQKKGCIPLQSETLSYVNNICRHPKLSAY